MSSPLTREQETAADAVAAKVFAVQSGRAANLRCLQARASVRAELSAVNVVNGDAALGTWEVHEYLGPSGRGCEAWLTVGDKRRGWHSGPERHRDGIVAWQQRTGRP